MTVLITGAAGGIGLALTQAYLARGEKVIAVCRTSHETLDASGAEVIANIDVTCDSDIQKLQQALLGRKLHCLINNAGILFNESLNELNFEQIERQWQVNAIAPLKITHTLLGHLSQGSKVAIITSRMGSIADNTSGGMYGYRMSKAAVNAAGKSLAMDLKEQAISVALLHPGYVSTKMVGFNGQISPEQSAKGLLQRIDELNLENTGGFWHADGGVLPW